MLFLFELFFILISFVSNIQIIDYFPKELMLKYQILIKELGDV
jgi:hypothetical protein